MKKNFIRVAALAMSMMMVFSGIAFADGENEAKKTVMQDWKGLSYEAAVEALVADGVVSFDEDGQFHGNKDLTRAQASKIVVLTMAPKKTDFSGYAVKAKSSFNDMVGAGWAAGYIGYAVEKGLVQGYGNGKFGPSDKVTIPQLAAILARATGKNVSGSDWAKSAVKAAEEAGYLEGIKLSNYDVVAQKWMCAVMNYNAKADLKKAGEEKPVNNEDKPVNAGDYKFAKNEAFGDNLEAFGDFPFAKNAKIYTYGSRSEYNEKMTVPAAKELTLDNVFKYKNVVTPALYVVENKQIKTLIVPGDVGFSGNAFGAVTGRVTMANQEGKAVAAFETIVAGNEITWLAKDTATTLVTQAQIDEAISNGAICQINLNGGQVKNIYLGSDVQAYCHEFTSTAGVGAWREVENVKNNGVIKVSDAAIGNVFAAERVAVYVYDENDKCYKVGELSDITIGDFIRAYDVYEKDKEDAANIIFVMPEKSYGK